MSPSFLLQLFEPNICLHFLDLGGRRWKLILTFRPNSTGVGFLFNERRDPLLGIRVRNSSSDGDPVPLALVLVAWGMKNTMEGILLQPRSLDMDHAVIRADSTGGKVVVVVPCSTFSLADVCCVSRPLFSLDIRPIICRLPIDYFFAIIEVRSLIKDGGCYRLR